MCCALLGPVQRAWAQDEKPAPEPIDPQAGTREHPDGAPAGEEKREQPKPRDSDPEADYLALADAPIFLPRSYLYWGTPVGPKGLRQDMVFALEYALHLAIFSDLRDRALSGGRWAGAATLSFEGDLRMLALESRPVRMPSYRPNLSGQLFYLWHRPEPLLFGLRAGVFHYSNGQEQCAFNETYRDDSPECDAATDQVTNAQQQLNRRNGNFSTNGWLLELNGRIHQVNAKGVAIGHLAAGLSILSVVQRGALAMEPALRRLYGWGRLGFSAEGKKRFGWANMTVRGAAYYYPSTDGRTPSKAGLVELVLGPYWLTGLGFFARYYGGRDFYNAFFVDSLQQFAAGLAWDGERPLKFKRDD